MVKQNGDFILDVNQRREFEKLVIDRHVYLSSGREERKPARARWASALPGILGTTAGTLTGQRERKGWLKCELDLALMMQRGLG